MKLPRESLQKLQIFRLNLTATKHSAEIRFSHRHFQAGNENAAQGSLYGRSDRNMIWLFRLQTRRFRGETRNFDGLDDNLSLGERKFVGQGQMDHCLMAGRRQPGKLSSGSTR